MSGKPARFKDPAPLMKRRHIKLTFVSSGESVQAELLDDEAPNVCAHVWSILPVETKVIHGMYSGLEVFAMLDNPKPAPNENMVQLPEYARQGRVIR